jgi:hypothetical protein
MAIKDELQWRRKTTTTETVVTVTTLVAGTELLHHGGFEAWAQDGNLAVQA